MIYLQLPFPPALNRYYRRWNNRTLISAEGRRYRRVIQHQASLERWPSLGQSRLRMSINALPPDRRRRDLDGMLKATLDALEASGLYDNDEQIDDLRIIRGPVTHGGVLRIEIEPVAQQDQQENTA